MGFECEYHQVTDSANVIVGKDYLSTLEVRLKTLETALANVQGQLHEIRHSNERKPRPSSPSDCQELTNGIVLQDSERESEQVDAMGAVVFMNEDESGDVALHSPEGDTNSERFKDGGLFNFSKLNSPQSNLSSKYKGIVDIYAIPPEPQVMDLLHRYFSYPGYFFPYIHEDTFIETYNQIKNAKRPSVTRSWLGLFNIVLAMAVSTKIDKNVDAVERFHESDIYYQRAYGLCGKLMLRGASLEIVQYLLLMGQYLQGTQKSIEAWVVHGLAVKAAIQLGIHSSEASKHLTPLEREVRKRTWFGCVIHDRALALTFGRPCTIPDDYVKLELPKEDGFYPVPSASNSSEARNSINIHFLNATIQVYNILWAIIEQLYGQNIGCGGSLNTNEIVTRLFSLEQKLSSWEQDLRPELRSLTYDQLMIMRGQTALTANQRAAQTLRIVLTLRHLNIRLLLHRPILVKFLEPESDSFDDIHDLQILRQIGSHSLQVCMHIAEEIISIVHTVVMSLGTTRTTIGAWWYTLYYTFNAALVVFGCFLIGRSEANIHSDFAKVTAADTVALLDKAIVATENVDKGNHIVDRYKPTSNNITGPSRELVGMSEAGFMVDSADMLGFDDSTFARPTPRKPLQSQNITPEKRMDEPPAKRARRAGDSNSRPSPEPSSSGRSKTVRASRRDDGNSRRNRSRSRSYDQGDRQKEDHRSREQSHRNRDRERDLDRTRDRDRGARDEDRDRERGNGGRQSNGAGHRERSRSRERHRSSKDHRSERSHRHSRSRSPVRNGNSNTPVRARSPPRRSDHDRIRPSNHIKPEEDRPKGTATASSTSTKSDNAKAPPNVKDDAMVVDEDEDDALLRRMMGFTTFKTTQDTKVPGNQIYGVRKEKKTEYRQYMNRVGGFNRPLSPSRM
ncbi:hypothetical protein LTR84_002852 [Exophiala bonariae]|uniref:Xylanolytic transcriptional activator regulatory domain-containing protein n=1 Tax=Exophiala bonariae TaxID=1690606 RepID=A0AAV9N922_9EURO|nr:hypothetical protein LTR84_002852 [Exophiala bonariae]